MDDSSADGEQSNSKIPKKEEVIVGEDSADVKMKCVDSEEAEKQKIAALKKKKENKARLQKKIQISFPKYFKQVTEGCGSLNCPNKNCASHGGVLRKPLSKAEGVKKALNLASNALIASNAEAKQYEMCNKKTLLPLSYKELQEMIESSKDEDFKTPIHRMGAFWADQDSITASFFKAPSIEIDDSGNSSNSNSSSSGCSSNSSNSNSGSSSSSSNSSSISDGLSSVSKDKNNCDKSSGASNDNNSKLSLRDQLVNSVTEADPCIDFDELHRTYELMNSEVKIFNAFANGIRRLCKSMDTVNTSVFSLSQLRMYLIIFDLRLFQDMDHHDAFKYFVKAVSRLNSDQKQILTNWISTYSKDRLENAVAMLQQYIIVTLFTSRLFDSALEHSVSTLKLCHDANILLEKKHNENPTLGIEYLGYDEFYNDAINQLPFQLVFEDYKRWKELDFSFCSHPYLLEPAAKARILQLDAEEQMKASYERAIISSIFNGISPFLVLRIERSNIVEDTLLQIQQYRKEDYKKPLKVKFKGEEGVDEGGVQKEFFQLIIAALFDPAFDTWKYSDETHQFWFNKDSMTPPIEYELIGIMLGLAIYNSVILDVRFPMSVYKKLMGHELTLDDLASTMPSLAKGLQDLLVFDGNVEETYCREFSISYEVYGEEKVAELKEGGKDIPLTNDNRQEYVDLYVKYILHTSIQTKWEKFEKGFRDVAAGEPLSMFRYEELELLVCGSPELDFEALQETTRYDDGFTGEEPLIKQFWEILHELPEEDQKKFLSFTTGSDRVPIKGLGNLGLTISKNGPDSERLPTSHTCFNHLLLPEYSSKEKLKRCLLLAIQNCKGFGLM